MDHKKWLVVFAGIASLSIAYYFVLFLPEERQMAESRRQDNRLEYEGCLTNAAAESDMFLKMNGGVFSEDGTRVTAPNSVMVQAGEHRRNAERLCAERFPAGQR
jgi:hypothetical protein